MSSVKLNFSLFVSNEGKKAVVSSGNKSVTLSPMILLPLEGEWQKDFSATLELKDFHSLLTTWDSKDYPYGSDLSLKNLDKKSIFPYFRFMVKKDQYCDLQYDCKKTKTRERILLWKDESEKLLEFLKTLV